MEAKTRKHLIVGVVAAVVVVIAIVVAIVMTTNNAVQQNSPTDLDEYLLSNTEQVTDEKTGKTTRNLAIDYTKVNEHPVTGYYTYTLDSGRTIKIYIPEHAALRNYINVIAVPNDTKDTYAFLQEQGWIDQADQYGELLFVLEPADGTWGTPEEEADYLNTCIGETISNTAFDTRSTSNSLLQSGTIPLSDGSTCSVFTGHSCNYYIGYGDGCAVLESWTSNNPLYVAGQAFINGQSVGSDFLNKSSQRVYNGINTSSAYTGFEDEEWSSVLTKMSNEDAAPNNDFITNADVPAPTLFVGYATNDESVQYWKNVNDAVETDESGVYRQSLDSDAWQTEYANSNAKNWGSEYGVSEVKVVDGDSLPASDIRSFLSKYTRYTNCFAYSNTLGPRADYYAITKKAREQAEEGKAIESFIYEGNDGTDKTVEERALQSTRIENPGGSPTSGTLYSCMFAFNDYDNDGKMDPRETLIYIPDSAKAIGENGVPAVIVWPGNTQSASTFFDCSMWWSIANDEGCAIVIMGEYTASSAASLTYGDSVDNINFSRSALTVLENAVAKDANITIDTTRIYASGHSAGSQQAQTLTHNTESDYFAAVGSTSNANKEFSAETVMPSFMTLGQEDNAKSACGNMVKSPWDNSEDSAAYNWVTGCTNQNGISIKFTANDHDSFVSTCSDYSEEGRYYTYVWSDGDTPLVQFGRTLAREHNCLPNEFRLVWDFMSHYQKADDGTRYYSPPAFEEDDAVAINQIYERERLLSVQLWDEMISQSFDPE